MSPEALEGEQRAAHIELEEWMESPRLGNVADAIKRAFESEFASVRVVYGSSNTVSKTTFDVFVRD